MTYFNLGIDTLILRFYLLMLVVIVSIFGGFPIAAFLAVPIFLSGMLGVNFKSKKSKSVNQA